ncbi:CCCH-type zinc finger/KH domain containing protein, putative [Leishmania lindenbergi]|uniref:ATP-dependent RNA helicase n=1 Tax=Leishmania lindenbergi TaxID=651832 RepID=A0AAW3A7N1_9TRYP
MSQQNAVEALLARLRMGDAIPAFQAMGVDRIVSLRKMSEDALRQAVPDAEQRQALMNAIESRGHLQSRRVGPPVDQPHPPRSADAEFARSGNDESRSGYALRGDRGDRVARGGRGGGRSTGAPNGDDATRLCRHVFTTDGCKFGQKCRYSHDGNDYRRPQEVPMDSGVAQRSLDRPPQNFKFSIDVEIPTERIKYLLGPQGINMRFINETCGTYNERFAHVDETEDTFTIHLLGGSEEAVNKAKEMLLMSVGVKREEEKKDRFQYAVNELDANTHAARLFAACNTKNKDTTRHLSDSIMRNIVSSFNFVRPQEVRHFYMYTSCSDKDKLEMVSKIVSQLKGVQAILFCDQKRVEEMCKGSQRIARHFNRVNPQFVYRRLSKEDRMIALDKFKKGVVNENGVLERLLVTNEDYAKLARKTVIPYVNLVINFSVPRAEEYYVLQSQVAGRQGTIGASFLCVSNYEEALFRELEKNIHFERFEDEDDFRSTAVELSYDTDAQPLTPEDADPPADWREHLNDRKPPQSFGKRR